jgi:Protein of unknown function (DUF4242)
LVKVFLVERDLEGISMADLAMTQMQAVRQAALMYDEGDRVRYVRSVFVPQDGRCLCLFEARNADVVTRLNRAGRLPFERILPAMDLTPWLGKPDGFATSWG